MSVSAWQLITEFELSIYILDGDYLLYHSGTGATHRLNGIYGLVFSIFWDDRKPLGIDDLIVSISKQLDSILKAEEVKKTVESLLELCLIKSVDRLG